MNSANKTMTSEEERKALKLLLKDCAAGFYQQMYFLGKDVVHPSGNQLREYGFIKSPSTGLKGTSCYTLETTQKTIELYGSCAACYTEDSKVAFLRPRSRFFHWRPEHRCVAGRWTGADIESGTPNSLFQGVTPLLQWWIEYEKWILETFGAEYREACFREWKHFKKKKAWLPPHEATQWVELFLHNGSTHHVAAVSRRNPR